MQNKNLVKFVKKEFKLSYKMLAQSLGIPVQTLKDIASGKTVEPKKNSTKWAITQMKNVYRAYRPFYGKVIDKLLKR